MTTKKPSNDSSSSKSENRVMNLNVLKNSSIMIRSELNTSRAWENNSTRDGIDLVFNDDDDEDDDFRTNGVVASSLFLNLGGQTADRLVDQQQQPATTNVNQKNSATRFGGRRVFNNKSFLEILEIMIMLFLSFLFVLF